MYIHLYSKPRHQRAKSIDLSQIFHYFVNLTLVIIIQMSVSYLLLNYMLKPKTNLIAQAAMISPVPEQGQVLSAASDNNNQPTITPEPTGVEIIVLPTEVLKQEKQTFTTPKSFYKIAAFGDSMVDTAGERLEYFNNALEARYPQTKFEMYNYGKGAQTVSKGLELFHQPLQYKDRNYPSVDEVKPDIIIIGSFAYNPYTPHDPNKHWLELTEMVKQAQSITPNVYIMAEIAPLRNNFSQGPGGPNYETHTAYAHSGRIIEQLKGAVGLARELNVGLIDCFNPSIIGSDGTGNSSYVNPSDGIHPSADGFRFMAEIVAKNLKF